MINIWYLQDGAISPQVIQRCDDVHWSPQLPDLTVPDFFFSETLKKLKENILNEISKIPHNMCKNVI